MALPSAETFHQNISRHAPCFSVFPPEKIEYARNLAINKKCRFPIRVTPTQVTKNQSERNLFTGHS